MITRIEISKVASYKDSALLETDKKVNLIYGLNGSGKTTLSNFLYDPHDREFSNCAISGIDSSTELFVYNQKFIQDNFYVSDELPGIFTLSKANKEAEQKIREANAEVAKLNGQKEKHDENANKIQSDKESAINRARDAVWKIKTDFAGGDRVLEYCLDGLKKKEKLFSHIAGVVKPSVKPSKTIELLKSEIEAVHGENAQTYTEIPLLSFHAADTESNEIFQKEIVGNQNSTVASLIEHLGNSDWVKDGIQYLEETEKTQRCPFCQNETVTAELISDIKAFFDKSYEDDIAAIEGLKNGYTGKKASVVQWAVFESHGFIQKEKAQFQIAYDAIVTAINSNIEKIDRKLKSPASSVELTHTLPLVTAFNDLVNSVNTKIKENNRKIAQKDKTLQAIKTEFWNLMRWEYDQPIQQYKTENQNIKSREDALSANIKVVSGGLATQQQILRAEQKKTVNIDDAIGSINAGLVDLGIDGFSISKQEGNFYRIERAGKGEKTFHTLSEGEKMIISFLYFLELCKGKRRADSISTKKIVVIDDPISSLSHIYIFNVAQLIKAHFTKPDSKCEQVFILTHSLYFFYDLTMTNHEKREETQKLFRIVKDSSSSKIEEMKYEHIQNDYHAYWQVVKDPGSSPALLANCMRNIIEYFFNFVEKQALSNVSQRKELQSSKHQAFFRYVNRESHSLGQNIFDIKEFDYDAFKEAFEMVFNESGFGNHYKRMMR